jgi:aminopeptidase N
VGDEAFTAILRTYFDTYRYGMGNGPDFLALAEDVSGQDLTDLYQEWFEDTVRAAP